ncbi:MAG TPA: 4Fe-4S dicluster domain-containing protein [Caldisericia bacterium]|nr:4Fe-4S dicluster domain-containing protein [Caldisericia bacterium]HPF49146.1 4Fe-4S dicluster domain-containing protein [Caldisericia bacterium]HPI82990.1 4Fe-4S dicluster domain-containing protein [Caldisericia bacterium]HPQ92217.1 4Fe-4S dicluster domain-containing protein [Caldisericia bacterium]HRV74685.1 4Fe-4S dicluster domain-containing protein [Caldisericia bacterium]
MSTYKVELFRKFCKSCQICLRICPKQVFSINERGQVIVEDDSRCIGCMQCCNLCPDFALEVTKNGD